MTEITVAPSDDVALVSAVLAQAFAADPVIRWLNPDPRRDVRIFHTLVRWVHGPRATVDLATRDGVAVGAGVWDRPGHRLSSGQQVASIFSFLRALGPRIGRGAALERVFTPKRPTEPHWYLGQLGAATPGLGVGTALLTEGAGRVDADGVPAYLESSNEANVPLYERFGFQVIDEVVLPHDGPTVWLMYRK